MSIGRAVGAPRVLRKLHCHRILRIVFTLIILYGWRAPASTSQVVGWGYNSQWQTILPSDTTNVVAIAAGLEHSLVLLNNGKVLAYGGGAEAIVPAGLTGVKAVAAGQQ